MRPLLAFLLIIIGTSIGINAIKQISNIQDAKLQRICKQLPIGASYDEMCKDFR